MEPKKIALLVGALVIAAVTAVMAKSMFSQSAPAAVAKMIAPAPTGPEVLVATRALPVGTILGPDSFRYQPWPKDLIQNAYYMKGKMEPQSLAGTVVRNTISAGQPITQGSLVEPGDRGFLAAALGAGMRAVTITVNGTAAGVAGFAFPGDHIDLMLTQTVTGDGPPLKTVETIVRNLRVLATDQRSTQPVDDKGQKTVMTFATITLEVTPRIAEKIAVAQTFGQLTLSLRSIADNTADLDRAIASGEVNVPNGMDPKTDKVALAAMASRPTDGSSYVTGADVSRFQRRSVPLVAPSPTSNLSRLGTAVAMTATTGKVVVATNVPIVRIARGNVVTEVPFGGK
jgi:Flp pilus assembly protein CpaB